MNDAAEQARRIDLGRQVELALAEEHGGIVAALLRRSRADSTEAMHALCDVAPTDAEAVRALQNIVHRHDSLVLWMQEILSEARDAWEQVSDDERAELELILGIRSD